MEANLYSIRGRSKDARYLRVCETALTKALRLQLFSDFSKM